MIDIVPALNSDISDRYNDLLSRSKSIDKYKTKLSDGVATYKDAYAYAGEVGNIRAKAFKNCINSNVLPDGKMYYNIANEVVRGALETDHSAIADYCQKVQAISNKRNGIGLAVQVPDLDEDRLMGFINRISYEPIYDDIAWILDEPVKTFDRKIVDDSVKKNAEFQYSAGVKATVVRIADSGCCLWCDGLTGEFTYPSVPSEIFARHDNCKCTLEYNAQKLMAYTSRSGRTNTFR